jgi:hypothetical protein
METGTMRLTRRLIRGTGIALAIIVAAAIERAFYCSFLEAGTTPPSSNFSNQINH